MGVLKELKELVRDLGGASRAETITKAVDKIPVNGDIDITPITQAQIDRLF